MFRYKYRTKLNAQPLAHDNDNYARLPDTEIDDLTNFLRLSR